ncbi:MAG: flagellar hook basal-body protein [Phycisphaeraceae bacterium]|nr:flagellar hook basal-body protein [Phycisphaeraceae bacterium]
MNYGLYLSAMGVLANMHRQDVAASNLSNVQTDGFKRNLAMFDARPPESAEDGPADLAHPLLDRIGGGIQIAPTQIDLSEGTLRQTGRELDVALEGPGFFAVQTESPDGGTAQRLTRDGRWTLAASGELVTVTGGFKLLGENGLPVRIDPAEGKLSIDQTGRISQAGEPIGRLRLLDAPAEALKQLGQGLFEHDPKRADALRPATVDGGTVVRQGHLEGSNVDPIKELMNLIAATKAVTRNGNMIRYHDRVMDRAVNVLGRVG